MLVNFMRCYETFSSCFIPLYRYVSLLRFTMPLRNIVKYTFIHHNGEMTKIVLTIYVICFVCPSFFPVTTQLFSQLFIHSYLSVLVRIILHSYVAFIDISYIYFIFAHIKCEETLMILYLRAKKIMLKKKQKLENFLNNDLQNMREFNPNIYKFITCLTLYLCKPVCGHMWAFYTATSVSSNSKGNPW